MPVTFEDNYLRLVEPQLCLPGQKPADGFYLTGRNYPIDETGKSLVEVVARKGWDIPGIDVKFYIYGSAESPLMIVREISGGAPGNKWRVRYGRPEFTNGQYMVTTAVDTVHTPLQEFTVYEDDSGPTLYRYAGSDWQNDEDRFMNGPKVNSRLYGEAKTYLKYTGEGHKGRAHDTVVHDNDLEREYDPEPAKGEPTRISKAEMFFVATESLRAAIKKIDAENPDHETDPKTRLRQLSKIDIVPVPQNTPTLIVTEKYTRQDSRVLVAGSGWRLVDLSTRNDPARPFPERAYDGFSYGFAQDPFHSNISSIGEDPRSSDTRIMKVNLNRANDVFVVDEAVYEAARQAFKRVANSENRDCFTGAEVSEMKAAFARTMVPLDKYDGSYLKPIYLIGRPLDSEEAQDVTEEVRQPDPKNTRNPRLNFAPALDR